MNTVMTFCISFYCLQGLLRLVYYLTLKRRVRGNYYNYNHLNDAAGENELNCSHSQIWQVEELGHKPTCLCLKILLCVCVCVCVGPDA